MRRSAALVVALVACTAAPPDTTATTEVPSPPPTIAATTTTASVIGTDGANGLGDRMFPELGNAGYDVLTYHIDLTFDAGLAELEGDVTIEAEATMALRSFTVDLVGYTVTSVQVDGDESAFERGPRDMRIIPPDVILSGQIFTVAVTYHGSPAPVDLTDFAFPTGWQRTRSGSLFLFSEPDGASGVFPANDHPSDRADVFLTVRVPEPHVVVSGGEAAAVSVEDGLGVHSFHIPRVAPYLVPLAIGGFTPTETPDGVVTWMGGDAALPEGFDRQGEILDTFEEDLGPYPFGHTGAVVLDSDLPAALETQTLSTYTTVSAGWGTLVIAHELAHHWFGNEISLGQWDDIWLNEGFATFMTWRWVERDAGKDAYESQVRAAWEAVSVPGLPPPDHPPGHDLFNVSVYQRGGLALAALREFVGDAEFFSFLRSYVAAFAGETVTTESFLTFVLVVLGPQAEDLVTDWVRSEDLPSYPLG